MQGFPVAQLVKNPPAMQETWVRSLGWDDPLEKGKATHSSILAWRIHSPWGCKESDTTERLSLSYSYKGINDVIAKIKVLQGSDNTLATKKIHFSLS